MSVDMPGTILLVEDEAIIALAERKTLERYGFTVVTALTGEAAVEAVEVEPGIDLVLMDINLGAGIDGTVAASRILAKRDLPVVFLSSHTEREVVDKTEGISSYGYIVKHSGDIVLFASIRMAYKLFDSRAKEKARHQDLLASEEKYRLLIEHSHDIIYTLTAEGVFTFVSPAWTSLLGHPGDTVVGRSIDLFVHPDDLSACKAWLRKLLESGRRPKDIEYRVRHLDGSWRWHASSVDLLRDKSGAIVGFEGVARDVTAAAEARLALEAEKRLVSAIFDSVPGLLYLYDADGRLVRWNRRHETMTGYGSDELSRMHLMDWYSGDEKSQRAVAEGIRTTMEKGFGEAEASLQRKDGTAIPMYFTASPVMIDGKQYFTGIGLDLSSRRGAEEALVRSERNLQSLFDAIEESVCFLERDGKVVAANKTFAARVGKTVEECVGVDAYSLIPLDLARQRRPRVAEAFETGKPVSFDDKRGERWIHQILYPVVEADGRTDRLVIYATDITEQKNLHESLRVSEALYRTLFAILPVGLTISDTSGTIVDSNDLAETILGLSREEHRGRKIDSREWCIVRRDGSHMPASEFASTRALKEGRSVENVEMGIVKGADGVTWITVSAAAVPIEGYGVVIAYSDITERILAEERAESLLREKDLVLKETHHRVKNNMGTVKSLLSLYAENHEGDAAGEILKAAAGCVQSMMLLYDRLYLSENFKDLGIDEFIPSLVAQIVAAYSAGSNVETRVEVGNFILDSKTLSTLGIIVNELITNSMKYAFAGVARGRIDVTAFKDGQKVTITYEDNGPGLPESVSVEESSGFGMQLIGLLVAQLGGSVRIDRDRGARFVITFDA